MMVRIIIEEEGNLYPMGVDEESLNLVPVNKATLFFSKGEAERFVLQNERKANNYRNKIAEIESEDSRKMVKSFILEQIKGSLIGALFNGAKISYLCG